MGWMCRNCGGRLTRVEPHDPAVFVCAVCDRTQLHPHIWKNIRPQGYERKTRYKRFVAQFKPSDDEVVPLSEATRNKIEEAWKTKRWTLSERLHKRFGTPSLPEATQTKLVARFEALQRAYEAHKKALTDEADLERLKLGIKLLGLYRRAQELKRQADAEAKRVL